MPHHPPGADGNLLPEPQHPELPKHSAHHRSGLEKKKRVHLYGSAFQTSSSSPELAALTILILQVLACLIIRLALAQTFCLDYAVLSPYNEHH